MKTTTTKRNLDSRLCWAPKLTRMNIFGFVWYLSDKTIDIAWSVELVHSSCLVLFVYEECDVWGFYVRFRGSGTEHLFIILYFPCMAFSTLGGDYSPKRHTYGAAKRVIHWRYREPCFYFLTVTVVRSNDKQNWSRNTNSS